MAESAIMINNVSQPKYFSIVTPLKVKTETMLPAINTPIAIKGKATLNGIPKRKAASELVHPPVIGKGMAAKITRAFLPCFSIEGVMFFLVRWKSQSKNFWNIKKFFDKKWATGSKNNNNKTTGIRFPKYEIKKTSQKGRLSPATPTGIAPLNSEIGAIAKSKT